LMEFSAEDPDQPRTRVIHSATQGRIGSFTGMALSRDEVLWISGVHGLARVAPPARNISPETEWQEYVLPQELQLENLSEPELDDDGGVNLMVEMMFDHKKTVVTFDGHKWVVRPTGPENFFCAWRGPNKTFCAGTSESLFQW